MNNFFDIAAKSSEAAKIEQNQSAQRFDADTRIDAEKNKKDDGKNKRFDPDKRIDIKADVNEFIEEWQQFEPNSSFLRDGHEYQTDDAGRIYRYDNELLPNNEYEINGYKYKTDDLGRVTSAEGEAHLKTHEGKLVIKDSKETIGHGEAKETDDRGHLVGDQLDGSNGMENIVAQDSGINQGAYRKLEDYLASAIKDGHDVDIKVEPIYGEKLSYRPTEIKYTYTIDGEKNITLFPNGR